MSLAYLALLVSGETFRATPTYNLRQFFLEALVIRRADGLHGDLRYSSCKSRKPWNCPVRLVLITKVRAIIGTLDIGTQRFPAHHRIVLNNPFEPEFYLQPHCIQKEDT